MSFKCPFCPRRLATNQGITSHISQTQTCRDKLNTFYDNLNAQLDQAGPSSTRRDEDALPIFPVTSQMIRHLRPVCNKRDIDVQLLRMPRMRMTLQSSQKVKFGSTTMMRTGRLVRQDNHAKRVLSSIVTRRERPDWNHGRRLKVRMSGNWHGG
jgi:hypothetical protein